MILTGFCLTNLLTRVVDNLRLTFALVPQALMSGLALHFLTVIVYPMLYQFYGVFLGFNRGWETNFIM